MKKLGSIKMHDAAVMTDSEMKRIVGGNLPTTTVPTQANCSTVCKNADGTEETHTKECGVGVACHATRYVEVYCAGDKDNGVFCKKDDTAY